MYVTLNTVVLLGSRRLMTRQGYSTLAKVGKAGQGVSRRLATAKMLAPQADTRPACARIPDPPPQPLVPLRTRIE